MLLSGKDVSFCYSSQPAATVSPSRQKVSQLQAPWDCDIHRYPDLMALVCRVESDMLLSSHVVGAFCGDECRGIGVQIGDLVFLIVHGTLGSGERIGFRLYDVETDEEQPLAETLTLDVNCLGTPRQPLSLHLDGITNVPQVDVAGDAFDVYTLTGLKVRSQVTTLKGLPHGTYVVRGKVVIL